MPMGFPGDEDPLFAKEEHFCPDCEEILDVGEGWALCPACGFCEITEPDAPDMLNEYSD